MDFFDDLDSLQRMTLSLRAFPGRFCCLRCRQSDQFVSHGFVYKKALRGQKRIVGKRLFCANRHARTGCGATLRLFLADTLPGLQHDAARVQAFLLALLAGAAVAQAYCLATGAPSARHAWRWLDGVVRRLGALRAGLVRAAHDDRPFGGRCRRLRLVLPTLAALRAQWGEAFVARFQWHRQQPFLA